VATKTPVATAMAGEQTTINKQPKAAASTATETVTMTARTMTMETKATAVAAVAEARRQRGGDGQLGSGGGSWPRARRWRRWQRGGGVGRFDCCVSDGEDEPGSPFAKPQVHKASSVALPACHCCIFAKGKALIFQMDPLIFSDGIVCRNET
jgi:hypothetical protein